MSIDKIKASRAIQKIKPLGRYALGGEPEPPMVPGGATANPDLPREDRITAAMREGWGEGDLGLSEESRRWLIEHGVYPSNAKDPSLLRRINRGVIESIEPVAEAALRGSNAMLHGAANVAGGYYDKLPLPSFIRNNLGTGAQLERDLVNMPNAFMPSVPGAYIDAVNITKAARGVERAGLRAGERGGINLGPEIPAKDAIPKTIKPTYAALPNIREMPYPEALAHAKTNAHIIPNKEGGYIGAPAHVRSPEDLSKMRQEYDAMIDAGAVPDSEGRFAYDWYDRVRGSVNEFSGGDPIKSRAVSQGLGITSPQSTPGTNLQFLTQGWNARQVAGVPASKMRTTSVAKNFNASMDEADLNLERMGLKNEDIPTGSGRSVKRTDNQDPARLAEEVIPTMAKGKKTNQYAKDIDPNQPNVGMGTNDTWQARIVGYRNPDGSLWDGSVTGNMHAFMDRENVLAADRANARKAGGKTDWTPQSIQSSGWVVAKGSDLAKKYKIPLEEGMTLANKSYGDEARLQTANIASEVVPASNSGGIADTVFNMSPSDLRTWAEKYRWTNSQGQHPLLSELDMLQLQQQNTTGRYVPPSGVPETNPVTLSSVLVRRKNQTANEPRMMDPTDKAVTDTFSKVDQMLNQQASTPVSLIESSGRGRNDVRIDMKRSPTSEEVVRINEVADKYKGMVSNTRDGLVIFGLPEETTKHLTKNLKGQFGADIRKAVGAEGKPVGFESNFLDTNYEELLDAKKAGKGLITEDVLQAFDKLKGTAPKAAETFENSVAVKNRAAANIKKMEETGGWESRPDIMKTMKILAESGYKGLREHVKEYGSSGLMSVGGLTALGFQSADKNEAR
tara:strand:+ start:302 stop:2842 length:2541 start_codon:yes stop_codon:yes gene_type:complete